MFAWKMTRPTTADRMSEKRVSIAQQNAEARRQAEEGRELNLTLTLTLTLTSTQARRKAEESWELVKKSFKRKWRPPGLMFY